MTIHLFQVTHDLLKIIIQHIVCNEENGIGELSKFNLDVILNVEKTTHMEHNVYTEIKRIFGFVKNQKLVNPFQSIKSEPVRRYLLSRAMSKTVVDVSTI